MVRTAGVDWLPESLDDGAAMAFDTLRATGRRRR